MSFILLAGATSVTAGVSSARFSSPVEPRGRIVGIPRLSNAEPATIICVIRCMPWHDMGWVRARMVVGAASWLASAPFAAGPPGLMTSPMDPHHIKHAPWPRNFFCTAATAAPPAPLARARGSPPSAPGGVHNTHVTDDEYPDVHAPLATAITGRGRPPQAIQTHRHRPQQPHAAPQRQLPAAASPACAAAAAAAPRHGGA